jgi:hypothetical protein
MSVSANAWALYVRAGERQTVGREVIGVISDTVLVLAAPKLSGCGNAGGSLGVPPTLKAGTSAAANGENASRIAPLIASWSTQS